jgi:hypothetical protein
LLFQIFQLVPLYATEQSFSNVLWHYVHRHPPGQFGGEGMAASYAEGHRAVSKVGAVHVCVRNYKSFLLFSTETAEL